MSYQPYNRVYGNNEVIECFVGTISPSSSFTPDNNWITWNKPKGVKFVHFVAIGGGGGGGGGGSRATGTTAGGGGGGSSAGVSKLFIPALFLPDTLYLKIGHGGYGGSGAPSGTSSGSKGHDGGDSIISFFPYATGNYGNFVYAPSGGGGNPGTSSTAGTGGFVGSIMSTTNAEFCVAGIYQNQSTGWNGNAASLVTTSPTDFQPFFYGTYVGGAGGSISAGTVRNPTTLAGGPWPSIALWYQVDSSFNYATGSVSGDGIGGYNIGTPILNLLESQSGLRAPLMFGGGRGGSSRSDGNGYKGGNGAIGSGGGGGGACIADFCSGGNGGDGGPGLIMITCSY